MRVQFPIINRLFESILLEGNIKGTGLSSVHFSCRAIRLSTHRVIKKRRYSLPVIVVDRDTILTRQ